MKSHIAPVMTAFLLAGCTDTAPMQPYYSAAPLPNVWNPPPDAYSSGGFYARPRSYERAVLPSPAAPPQRTSSFFPQALAAPQPQLRLPAQIEPAQPVDQDEDANPVDSSCGRWWRLSNLWCGS
jgi:hypothetical protein